MLFPYVWMPRTIWKNLSHAAYTIRQGICNVIRFAPVVWHDVDFDHSPILTYLEYKFKRMAAVQGQEHHADGAKLARTLCVCAELCRRLSEDDYFVNVGYNSTTWYRQSPARRCHLIQHSIDMQKQDQRYLGLLIGKYLTHWWD